MQFVAGGVHTSPEQTRATIAEYAAHGALHGYTFWGVEDRATGALLGDAGLYELHGQGSEVEFGVTLRRSAWGAGIGTACARLCCTIAFEQHGLDHLIAVAQPANVGSARLLRSAGFIQDGSMFAYGELLDRFRIDRPR